MGNLLDFLTANLTQFRKARIPSLYSDFRQQQYSNPDGYNANIAAWEAALALAAENQAIPGSTNMLSISSGSDLLEALESQEWGVPSAIGAVISEAVRQGHFVPRLIFLQARLGKVSASSTSTTWSLALWTLGLLGVSNWIPDKLPTERFVILANLKKNAVAKLQQFLEEPRGRVEQVWPIATFRKAVSQQLEVKGIISDDDFQVLLTHLSRDRKLLAYNESTIKFRVSTTESLQITEQDQSIASLKSLISELSNQTKNLTASIEDLNLKAVSAVGLKNRNAALRHLKFKKIQEGVLAQRTNTLFQLEDVLDQIEQAINQVEVMAVLKSSTKVLKNLNDKIGDVDSLQDVLDGINEEMMKTQEISNAIGDTTQAGLVIDEGEVDDELAALEADAQAGKTNDTVEQIQRMVEQLPMVTTEPKTTNTIHSAQYAIEEI